MNDRAKVDAYGALSELADRALAGRKFEQHAPARGVAECMKDGAQLRGQ